MRRAYAILTTTLALWSGCDSGVEQPPPEPAPAPATPPAIEASTSAPAAPAPTPEPELPPHCRLRTEQDVARAAVNTRKGGLYATTVTDKRELEFECPPVDEREGATIIAETPTTQILHWPGVDLEDSRELPGGESPTLRASDAQPDFPKTMTERDRARVFAKMGIAVEDRPVEAEPAKVAVRFAANDYNWAEIELRKPDGERAIKHFQLSPAASRSLAPGSYAVWARTKVGDEMREFGVLTIDGDKPRYTVQLLDREPWLRIR